MLANMNSIITLWHNALQRDGSCWTFIKIAIKTSIPPQFIFFSNELIVDALLIDSVASYLIGEQHTVLSYRVVDH